MTQSIHKVLIVEDNDAQRKVMAAVLSRVPNLQVETARTGTEGLEKVRNGEFAVIVLDMMLPEIDGLSFIDELRKVRPEGAPSIVAITAASESAIPNSIIEGPYGDLVRAVMRKPVDQKELAATVSLWAEGIALPDE